VIKNTVRAAVIAGILAAAAATQSAAQAPEQTITTTLLPSRGIAAARVVILLFSDFECSYCARVEPVLQEVRKAFAADVQVVFKHNPLPIHPRAPLAHEAALEAARQGRFWEMHDLIFANQQRLEEQHLVGYAEKLGLDMTAFREALADHRHKAAVDRDVAEGQALGLNSTPTLFVAGRKITGVPSAAQLIAYINSLLTGTPMTESAAALDPKTFDLQGSPARGPDDAPVTIVEFSDFQCPFCARATGTVENVWKSYNGKVRWVFKHYPLDFHPDAPLAHRAALAAGEQAKFWEMHDAIFRNQGRIKHDDLVRVAGELGLDMPRFLADLERDSHQALMKRDIAEGAKVGVDGTPTFFINGHRLVGAQPIAAFRAVIDRELNNATAVSFTRPLAGEIVPAERLDLAMSRGPLDSPVIIEWFADFGNPLHQDAIALLKRVLIAHPDDVRLVFRHRPLEGRPEAWLAHEAAMSAAEQGKFWEVHDLLVARPLLGKDALTDSVARLGLDRTWFEESMTTGRARAAVERQLAAAKALDVRGTPTFLINDTRIDGVISSDEIEAAIASALSVKRRKQQ
jgi:protein-disulfide isomerase